VLVTEKPLIVARARAIEADPQGRGDDEAHEVCARRRVHVQKRVEAPPSEGPPNRPVAAPAERLVEHDELDALEPLQQRVFGLADDPGELRCGPRALDCTHDRHRVASIADRREPDQAKLVGRVIERQQHAAY
jgi:hypothetical protein